MYTTINVEQIATRIVRMAKALASVFDTPQVRYLLRMLDSADTLGYHAARFLSQLPLGEQPAYWGFVFVNFTEYILRLVGGPTELTAEFGRAMIAQARSPMRAPLLRPQNNMERDVNSAMGRLARAETLPAAGTASYEFLQEIARALGGLNDPVAAAHFGVPHLA